MDILRLYKDYGVNHATEGHKHCRPGWVQTPCPFCTGNPGMHLGWNLRDEYFMCWRCGWHSPIKSLINILKISYDEVSQILEVYKFNRTKLEKIEIVKSDFKFPTNAEPGLLPQHEKYLLKRGFNNPKELAKKWNLMSTGPIANLGKISYKHRIIIPFMWNGSNVSFDSRDITGNALNKYQACSKEFETIEHKSILYGNQEAWNDFGIVVEGPTDVWRFGENACATSGIKYTPAQVRVISTIFKKVAVVFDYEQQAQIQAKKLIAELRFRGVEAFNVKVPNDPGSMSQKEADELVKEMKY